MVILYPIYFRNELLLFILYLRVSYDSQCDHRFFSLNTVNSLIFVII